VHTLQGHLEPTPPPKLSHSIQFTRCLESHFSLRVAQAKPNAPKLSDGPASASNAGVSSRPVRCSALLGDSLVVIREQILAVRISKDPAIGQDGDVAVGIENDHVRNTRLRDGGKCCLDSTATVDALRVADDDCNIARVHVAGSGKLTVTGTFGMRTDCLKVPNQDVVETVVILGLLCQCQMPFSDVMGGMKLLLECPEIIGREELERLGFHGTRMESPNAPKLSDGPVKASNAGASSWPVRCSALLGHWNLVGNAMHGKVFA